MRRFPPRDEPPQRRPRRDMPRPEGPFERLLRQRLQRDPAPIIIGGTIAFLALVIVLVFAFSSLTGGSSSNSNSSGSSGSTVEIAPGVQGKLSQIPGLPPGLEPVSDYVEFEVKDNKPPSIAGLGLPLRDKIDDPAGLGFYTFLEGRWQRLADVK